MTKVAYTVDYTETYTFEPGLKGLKKDYQDSAPCRAQILVILFNPLHPDSNLPPESNAQNPKNFAGFAEIKKEKRKKGQSVKG